MEYSSAAASLALALIACGGGVEKTSSAEPPAAAGAADAGQKPTAAQSAASVRTCDVPDDEPKGACTTGDRCAYAPIIGPQACDRYPAANTYPVYDSKPVCDCTSGAWTCRPTAIVGLAIGQCPGRAKRERTSCVTSERCASFCGGGVFPETCFTSLACEASASGGLACSRPDGGRGDDKCHAKCNNDKDCPQGEDCHEIAFSGCAELNLTAKKGICCIAGTDCD